MKKIILNSITVLVIASYLLVALATSQDIEFFELNLGIQSDLVAQTITLTNNDNIDYPDMGIELRRADTSSVSGFVTYRAPEKSLNPEQSVTLTWSEFKTSSNEVYPTDSIPFDLTIMLIDEEGRQGAQTFEF